MEVNFVFRIRSTVLGDGEYVTSFNLREFWNGLEGDDHYCRYP